MSGRSSRRAVVAVVVFVSVVAMAAFICHSSAPAVHRTIDDEPAASTPGVVLLGRVGPTGADHGVPVGWRHDEVGAQSAAAAFVESSGLAATAGPLSRRDVVLALATPAYGPALVAATDQQLDDLLFALGQSGVSPSELIWSEHALTAHSDVRTADEIDVQVWSVLVLAARTGSTPRQIWRTSTLTLRWIGGDWRVDRWSTALGPLPAPPAEVDVSSVAAVGEVVAWSPARPGGDS
jgi:hypothetical protein